MTCGQYNPFSWDSEFIVVWAWWSSGGKLNFFWYIYYLTVSKDEYCALSALWRRYREPYCRGALLHLLLVMARKKWSLSRLVSVRLHHLCVKYSDKILMLCPLWHSLILRRCFTSSHHTRRRYHHFKNMWYFPTLPLSRCPCTVLMPLSVIINFWLVQSVTVSELQDNWQVLVSQVWRACLCCRNHWTVKLSEWITPGSTDRELGVRWDGCWRSHRKSCIHRFIKDMLRTLDTESMFGIYQSHVFEMIKNANTVSD